MQNYFKNVKFDWLQASGEQYLNIDEDDEVFQYPLPPEEGHVSANILKTSHGVTVYKADHNYNSDQLGSKFSLANISGEFNTDTLMIGISSGADIKHLEHFPPCQVTYGANITIFRNASYYEFEAIHETKQPFVATYVSIPHASLDLLVGHTFREKILSNLGLTASPAIVTRQIPIRINKILQAAISPHLTGSMKKLYAQAKVLEYLCELVEYIESQKDKLSPLKKQIMAVYDLYDYLCNLEGKIPGLAELAGKTGMNVKTLNAMFTNEFGLPIHRFVTRHRMEQAHSAIQETSIALKILAGRLGYSHVNHFISAFKREFGYPPGQLRKI